MKFTSKLIILLVCLLLLVYIMYSRLGEAAETSALPEATDEPAAESAAVPTATVELTPTPTPEIKNYTISMVGDCTFWSNANYAEHSAGFKKTMNDDYSYPFANTVQYFESDDYTIANLECLLTDTTLQYDYTKATFAFQAPTAYANILINGGVDFVTTANNHLMDCYEKGRDNTYTALTEYGIPYGGEAQSQLVTTASGLKLGIYTCGIDMRPDWKTKEAIAAIGSLKEQGAEYIICMFHWGDELIYKPYDYQTTLAHDCIDAGADLIYGSHAHCLLPMEKYNDAFIFYGMGNWVFGGSTMPTDPNTAIAQVTLVRNADGTVSNESYNIIPCCVSSNIEGSRSKVQNYNDYKPTPYEAGSEEYNRVLALLDGSYAPESQGADYSDWWASRAS